MRKIVVVDDDPTNVGLTKMILEMDGFDVAACTGLEEAEAAAGDDVSAFVVDVNLARGANGLDLLRDIRAGETGAPKTTAVIMTSGDYRRESEAMDAGANLFLLKPYAPNVLSEALRDLTESGAQHG